MIQASLIVLALLFTTAAQADYRRFCVPQGQCFVCQRGQPTCEVTYAMSRGLTPPTAPSLNRILPPSPSPNPGPMFPERQYQPPPMSGQQRGLTEEEWRQAIIAEAQKFCEAYPRNQQCHWKEPPAQ